MALDPTLARVPSEDPRVRRFTQQLADMVNALVRQGELVQEQIGEYTVSGSASSVIRTQVFGK